MVFSLTRTFLLHPRFGVGIFSTLNRSSRRKKNKVTIIDDTFEKRGKTNQKKEKEEKEMLTVQESDLLSTKKRKKKKNRTCWERVLNYVYQRHLLPFSSCKKVLKSGMFGQTHVNCQLKYWKYKINCLF